MMGLATAITFYTIESLGAAVVRYTGKQILRAQNFEKTQTQRKQVIALI